MKPDLHTLASETQEVYDRIQGLTEMVNTAYEAALGKWDEETDTEVESGSGDDELIFEDAKNSLSKAQTAINRVSVSIATAQGFRDFAASGAVPA